MEGCDYMEEKGYGEQYRKEEFLLKKDNLLLML